MSDPFVGEIRLLAFGRAPTGWLLCQGQILPINQYQALYSLVGATYGPATPNTFSLPDRRGRTPVQVSTTLPLGTKVGQETVTLTSATTPTHYHAMQVSNAVATVDKTDNAWYANVAPDGSGVTNNLYGAPNALVALGASALGLTGSGLPHPNLQPFLALNYVIAVNGIYPSRP